MQKIGANRNRDLSAIEKLEQCGWNVIVVWGCELKPDKKESTLKCIERTLIQK